MAQPPEVEQLAAGLAAAYAAAWDALLVEAESIAREPSLFRRRSRAKSFLATAERSTSDLDALAAAWFVDDLSGAYRLGAVDATGVLRTTFEWLPADDEALRLLAAQPYDDLLRATQEVREGAKRVVRALSRRQALGGASRGSPAALSGRQLAQALARAGLRAITYRDGSRHGLGDYADVVIRTLTANAYNAAGIEQARRHGVRFMECFDGFGCGMATHNDPEKPNGKLYPTETAATFMLAHPRCQRSWSPRPDVLNESQARRARPSTTAEQQIDQAAAEERRAQAARDRARRRARRLRALAGRAP